MECRCESSSRNPCREPSCGEHASTATIMPMLPSRFVVVLAASYYFWIVAITHGVDSFLIQHHPVVRIRVANNPGQYLHKLQLSFSNNNNNNNPQSNDWNSPQQQQQRQQEARAKLAQLLNDKTIQGNPQFLYPLDQDDEQAIVEQNYISQYEVEQALEAQTIEGSSGTPHNTTDATVTNNDNGDDSFVFENDAVTLDSQAYLQLSQYMPQSADPQRGLPSDNDAYSSVLNKALSNQQSQRDLNQQRYRSIVQSLAQPAPNSPSTTTRRGKNNGNSSNSNARSQRSSQRRTPSSNPQSPSSPEPTVNDLMSAWQMASVNRNRTSQTLHEQVFAEEEGFRKQSALFRDSLVDPSKSRQAMAQRRKAAFDTRQAEAQEKLQEQLQEWEAVLLNSSKNVPAADKETSTTATNALSERVCCPQCQAILLRPEWERIKKVDARGQEMCDICYAERHFVDKPQPLRQRRILKHSRSPGGMATNRRSQITRGRSHSPIHSDSRRRQPPPLLDDWRLQQQPLRSSPNPTNPPSQQQQQQQQQQQRQATPDESPNNDHTEERDYKGWQQQLARDRQKQQQYKRQPPNRPTSTPPFSSKRKPGKNVPKPEDFRDVPF